MKIKYEHQEPIIVEVECCVESVGMYCNGAGITAMVQLEDSEDDSTSDHMVTWSELLSWAMASSQNDGDPEAICKGLRFVADKLEKWSNSFD